MTEAIQLINDWLLESDLPVNKENFLLQTKNKHLVRTCVNLACFVAYFLRIKFTNFTKKSLHEIQLGWTEEKLKNEELLPRLRYVEDIFAVIK